MPTRSREANGNAATRRSVDDAVQSARDLLRRSNCAGALQYVPELWSMLFLHILDEREAREAKEAEEFAERGAMKGLCRRRAPAHLRFLRDRLGAIVRPKGHRRDDDRHRAEVHDLPVTRRMGRGLSVNARVTEVRSGLLLLISCRGRLRA